MAPRGASKLNASLSSHVATRGSFKHKTAATAGGLFSYKVIGSIGVPFWDYFIGF